VLDLGCGYGEFINQVHCDQKFAMDLNPNAASFVGRDVKLIQRDCSEPWPLSDSCLDVVFTSNFFEHLPAKESLRRTLEEAFRCLKPNGRIICLGPNIKYLPGSYWDFWDHHLALTELSLKEGLELTGFRIEWLRAKFLPYSMSQGFTPPLLFLQIFLKLPFLWPIFGKQFLVIAAKPGSLQ
jgi:SAM-dependent methyltransferase